MAGNSSALLPAAASNTKSCYPVLWTPAGYTAPITDWFNTYAVTKVVADPQTGASNTALLAATTTTALDAALVAVAPLAARVDELVDVGAAGDVETTATTVRDAVAALTA